jgi:membrane-bound lytic murein transglycosylase A
MSWNSHRNFFQPTGDRPHGSINEPVIPMRSIAVNKTIFPAGCLTVISTELPRQTGSDVVLTPYCGFGLDQDTGGAFRAPGRCDVYMGIGDEAGDLAGRVRQEGKLYYLFLKQGAALPGSGVQPPPPTAGQ